LSSGEGEAVVLGGGGTGWPEGPVVALGGGRGCGEDVVVSVGATEEGIWPAGAATTRGGVGVVPMLASTPALSVEMNVSLRELFAVVTPIKINAVAVKGIAEVKPTF